MKCVIWVLLSFWLLTHSSYYKCHQSALPFQCHVVIVVLWKLDINQGDITKHKHANYQMQGNYLALCANTVKTSICCLILILLLFFTVSALWRQQTTIFDVNVPVMFLITRLINPFFLVIFNCVISKSNSWKLVRFHCFYQICSSSNLI